jgi:hypothetical protein
MGHVSEAAAESQLSAAARTRDHANFILLLAASASMHSSHPKWSLKAVLIVECAGNLIMSSFFGENG